MERKIPGTRPWDRGRKKGKKTEEAPRHRQILIKIHEGHELETREGETPELWLDGAPLDLFDGIVSDRRRLRQSFPRMAAAIAARRSPPVRRRSPYSVDLFLRLTLLDAREDHLAVLAALRRIDEVDFARLAARPSNKAPSDPAPDYAHPVTGKQGYLGLGRNGGIDARYAWDTPTGLPVVVADGSVTGTGASIDVCLIDQDFCDVHANIPLIPEDRIHGIGAGDDLHGSKVLGVLGAPHDAGDGSVGGTVGICRHATFHFSARKVEPTDEEVAAGIDPGIDYARALDAVLPDLPAGSVVVIECNSEVEASWTTPSGSGLGTGSAVPVEVDADVRSALRTAADDGVTTVEVAGNDNCWLGLIEDPTAPAGDTTVWDPDDLSDSSGAIIAGAGAATSRARSGSNYGDRVDCQAWGDAVVAPMCSPGSIGIGDNAYDLDFGGTSSAAAIIAGLVASLQGCVKAAAGAPLTPDHVRSLLRTDALGSPQVAEESETTLKHIGPLPDLYKILSHLEMPPRLHIRHHLHDVGDPSALLPNRSPDLVLRDSASTIFPLGAWMTEEPSEPVSPTSQIHYRVRNRGRGPDGAKLRFFWTEPSSFLHPAWWRPVVPAVSLPMTVPGVVRMGARALHAPKSAGKDIALIGLLFPQRNVDPDVLQLPLGMIPSPPPLLPSLSPVLAAVSTADFLDFARKSDSIGFRSVVWKTHTPSDRPVFEYRFRGVIEGTRTFRLEVATGLPSDAKLTITTDKEIQSTDVPAIHWGPGVGDYKGPPLTGSAEFSLGAMEEITFLVEVKLTGSTPAGSYESTIDQWMGSEHLGRHTMIVIVDS